MQIGQWMCVSDDNKMIADPDAGKNIKLALMRRGALVLLLFVLVPAAVSNPASKRTEVKRDHCNKTVEIYEDVSSPEVTAETFGRPMTCWYRFRSFRGTPKDWILRIRFKKFKVGTLVNASTCHMGYMQIVDGNAKTDVSNRKDPGLFCGETEQPQTFISETSFVKVLFHTDNFTDQTYFSFDSRAEQQFEVFLRYGQHPELYPNRRGEVVAGSYCERVFRDCRLQTCYVQSPAYPGVYPRNLHCRYHLNTRLPFIKLYIENEEFNIDGQRCENIMTCPMRPIASGYENCPYDYIRIYDGKDDSSPVIGTFCGMGKFPHSIIGTSQDLFVEFVSSPAGPLLNTGFHFNVGNWPGQVDTAGTKNGTCDWLLTTESLQKSGDTEGIFLSVPHWYPPHTSCTYLIRGLSNQVVRLYFPSFRITRIESPIKAFEGDCGESLTIYDSSWPDDSKIIKTFCDTFSRPMEKHDFVSSGNSLFVRFESKTGSYSGSSLYYWAHYDFFNNTRYGEPVAGTRCDEVIAAWKSNRGFLRSPPNTLVYKRGGSPTDDIKCLYRFVTDKRLYARIILNINAINFKEHPYASAPCQNCFEDRADKLVIWEPMPNGSNQTIPPRNPTNLHTVMEKEVGSCLCIKHAPFISLTKPYQVISSSEQLNLQMIVDNAHAASSYFKHPKSLFEASYEFVHSPLCGPATIEATADGEIMFPYLEALGYIDPPKDIKCIWDLRVNRDRDLWIHFDKIKFASKNCDDGKIDIYLSSRIEPYTSICGENASLAKEIPILSASELGTEFIQDVSLYQDDMRAIRIQFTSLSSPTRAAFKIAWTELFHLPRNSDGTLLTSRLVEGGSIDSKYNAEFGTDKRSVEVCDFLCAGENGLCIPARLICNGVVNCPNVTAAEQGTKSNREGRLQYMQENLRKIGFTGTLTEKMLETLSDESPELCNSRRESIVDYSWTVILMGGGGGLILGIACLVVMCKMCCHKRSNSETDLSY